MKRILYILIILFVLVLGMQMGNGVHNDNLQVNINDFENKIENGEDLSYEASTYKIESGLINKVAKKSESVIKNIVEKFKDLLN